MSRVLVSSDSGPKHQNTSIRHIFLVLCKSSSKLVALLHMLVALLQNEVRLKASNGRGGLVVFFVQGRGVLVFLLIF